MSDLKLQFLGTGTSQGIPVIANSHPVNFSEDTRDKRLRTSALLSKNGRNLNIDCGPDFRYQMLRANVQSMEGILFTHKHTDHIMGLDDTRPFIHLSRKPLEIFGNEETIQDIKVKFSYAFADVRYPGAPAFNAHILNGKAFDFAGFHIDPLHITHGNIEILGYLIDEKIAYITDASVIPDETLEKIKNVDVLVLNALRKSPKHHSHLTLQEAVDYTKLINPGRTYFTHISVELGFHEEVQAELPKNVFLAYDTLKVEI